jgi:serine/threonine protein kinase
MTRIGLHEAGERYLVHRRLGGGLVGETFLALDQTFDKTVVVRYLPSSRLSTSKLADRATGVAQKLQELDDPTVVPMSDVGVAEATHQAYIVRDFVFGQTAAEATAQGRLDLADVVSVGISLGEALQGVHEAGIVHGDLKPSNILLTPEGDVRLVDVGTAQVLGNLSQFLAHLPPKLRRALRGAAPLAEYFESSDYAAPELLRGEQVAPSTDLYAAGRVLAELTNAAPLHESTALIDPAAARLVRRGTAYSRPAAELQEVMSELLSPDPEARPEAQEFVERLRAVEGMFETERTRLPTPRSPSPSARFLNVWFEADEPVPPLLAETWYELGMNIGSRRRESAGSETFIEPDFGGREELDLLISLYSDELEIESHALELRLPRKGDSEEKTTKLRAPQPGLAKLDIVVSLLPQLEILQTLELALQVQPAVALVE